MKKLFIIAAAALMFTACSKDSEVVPSGEKNDNTAIGFQVLNKNMSRATAKLEDKGHYNFGVWAYKNTDATNEIMANYLVGFFGDATNPVGYSPTGVSNSTHGGTNSGNLTDAKSWWGYEGLGYTQYNWDSNTGTQYYLDTEDFYKSNVDVQYLRYWDLSSANTEFFAYAPYINGSTTPTFDNGTKVMTLPEGSIVAGYDDESKYEYLYAYSKVVKDDYKKDVVLNFLHLNSKIRIAFWEDIAGYSVKMEKLTERAPILAVPASVSGSVYSYSEILAKTAKTTINFSSTPASLATPESSETYKLGGSDAIDANINDKALVFKAPVATELATKKDEITDDDKSETIYYGIPHDSSCGLTFRVSFTLKSTTGETIKVQNAAVHVEAANCKWAPGYQYTYVFKITKDATGTTGPTTPTVDPNPGNQALYPIVFDGITVEDWAPNIDIDKDIK